MGVLGPFGPVVKGALKLMMKPLFGLPTPLANMAIFMGIYFRWQEFQQIASLATMSLLGREGAQCKLCDTVLMFAMKEAKVNKIRGGLDCNAICFAMGGKCKKMCKSVKDSMNNSTSYPCQAAGFCPTHDALDDYTGEVTCQWSYKKMGCLTKVDGKLVPAGNVCVHKLPASCELSPGVRRWRRMKRFSNEGLGALGKAFEQRAKYCSEEGAGALCIRDAMGTGRICQNLGYYVIAIFGTYLTVRAIESPGGADDRQWLVFWLIMFTCSYMERFTDLLLSWFSRYYELKLVFLFWLMFARPSGGAEKIYRWMRRRLNLARAFGRHFGTVAAHDDDYIRRLPEPIRAEIAKRGKESLRTVLEELGTSDRDIEKRYGAVAMSALWNHWNAVDPHVLVLRVVQATDLPVMDPGVVQELKMRDAASSPSPTTTKKRATTPSSAALVSATTMHDSDDSDKPLDMARKGYHKKNGHSKVDSYVVATLVPPNDQNLLLEKVTGDDGTATLYDDEPGHRRLKMGLWAPSVVHWARVRMITKSLSLIIYWRRRATSMAAIKSALQSRAPSLALHRLTRLVWELGLPSLLANTPFFDGQSGVLSSAFRGGALGPAGQYSRRTTSVRYNTSEPKYHQTLELRLPSRTVASDGSLTGNTVAAFTNLRLELWDSDLFSHDDFIGEATISLAPIMDGRRHRYVLKLTDPEDAFAAGEWTSLTGEVMIDVSLES